MTIQIQISKHHAHRRLRGAEGPGHGSTHDKAKLTAFAVIARAPMASYAVNIPAWASGIRFRWVSEQFP